MLVGKTGLNTIANEVQTQGYGAAHKMSKATGETLGVSNFGDETKLGSSRFQQANEKVTNDGVQAASGKTKEGLQAIEQFEKKQAYTKNATLSAMNQSSLDISQ